MCSVFDAAIPGNPLNSADNFVLATSQVNDLQHILEDWIEDYASRNPNILAISITTEALCQGNNNVAANGLTWGWPLWSANKQASSTRARQACGPRSSSSS